MQLSGAAADVAPDGRATTARRSTSCGRVCFGAWCCPAAPTTTTEPSPIYERPPLEPRSTASRPSPNSPSRGRRPARRVAATMPAGPMSGGALDRGSVERPPPRAAPLTAGRSPKGTRTDQGAMTAADHLDTSASNTSKPPDGSGKPRATTPSSARSRSARRGIARCRRRGCRHPPTRRRHRPRSCRRQGDRARRRRHLASTSPTP